MLLLPACGGRQATPPTAQASVSPAAPTAASQSPSPELTESPPTTARPAPPETIVAVSQDERIVVLRASDGSVVRTLTEPRTGDLGITGLALSPDRRTVWFGQHITAVPGECDSELVNIPVTGGQRTVLARSGADTIVGDPAPRPGTDSVAYVRGQCGTDDNSLVLQDPSGRERFIGGVSSLGWSKDGRRVLTAGYATDEPAELTFVEVDDGARITAETVLPALENPPGDCQTDAILYAAELLFGVTGCMGSGGYQGTLVLLDPASGGRSRVIVSLPPRVLFGSVSLDASGHHVLYGTEPFEDRDDAGSASLWGVWRLTLGEDRPVEVGRNLRYESAVW